MIINLSFGLTDFVPTQSSWLAVGQLKPLTQHELFVSKTYVSLVLKTFDTETIVFPVFVPLDLRRGGKQSASMAHASVKLFAPRALIFRPLVKENKD